VSEVWSLSATAIAALVRTREISAREAAQSALDRLAAVNPALNAVVDEIPELALAEADRVDAAIARGEDPGPLAGVPVTVKVNVDMAGRATTNGLRTQANLIAAEDNPVVANMRRAGGVIVGRTNTPAFSLRWFTRNALHGATRNPHDAGLTPGGSSGGAGAAVAAGIGAVAQGTDIAGSVRYPAYACGIHGLRPSFGRVPAANFTSPDRTGGAQLTAVSGPLARSIADLRLAFGAMAAGDVRDPWWVPVPLTLGPVPRRVALCVAPDGMATHPAVEQACRTAAARLADAGWEVEEIALPPIREAVALNMALWISEFRANGLPILDSEGDPDSQFVAAQMQAMVPADSGPNTAMRSRIALLRKWEMFLADWPVVICPNSAEPPFADHRDVSGPEAFAAVFEAQMIQVGLPALGLPGLCVSIGEPGAPMGVQLIAARFREDVLLDAGALIEAGSPPIRPVDPFVRG
jgi:amidase